MDPVLSAPAAPAPPSAPATISATRDAANKGSFADFEKATTAQRAGAPLPDVQAAPVAPAAPDKAAEVVAEAAKVSNRQQKINDYERRIAESDARIRDLEARLNTPPPAKAAAPEQAPEIPEWKRLAAQPGAPKLADFDSVEDHAAAMALFIADQRHAERTAEEQSRSEASALQTAARERVTRFVDQMTAAKTADPDFATKLTPEVHALKPFGALAPGEASGPRNVIAEQVYDSPIAAQVLLHFSQHPEALTALETMPPHLAALPPSARARAHVSWIVKQYAKLEASLDTPSAPAPAAPDRAAPSPISAAPPPPPTISRAGATSDPQASALARGDFGTFDKLDMQKRRERFARA